MYTALVSCCLILAVSAAVVPGPDEKTPVKQERRIQVEAPAQKTRIRPAAQINTIGEPRKRVTTTPRPHIAILKHVNRINSDGSYTYGYQGADGSFKLETRFATGEVKGKYGYIDADGEVIEITYGAAPGRGFEPVIEGVEVPPPVIKPQNPDYDYEYYDNYVQTEAPAPVRQRKPSRRQPSRVKVNRRIRPQPAREQVAAPADVPRVAPRTRPQISAPQEAPVVAPRAQPAPQEPPQFVPAVQQPEFVPVQQPARPVQPAQPLTNQDFSYNVPGSHSVSFSLPSFFTGGQQPFVPQAPAPAPSRTFPAPAPPRTFTAGSPVGLPATAAPNFGPRQHIPVLTAQQVHPALSKLDLNTGSYSLTVGGR